MCVFSGYTPLAHSAAQYGARARERFTSSQQKLYHQTIGLAHGTAAARASFAFSVSFFRSLPMRCVARDAGSVAGRARRRSGEIVESSELQHSRNSVFLSVREKHCCSAPLCWLSNRFSGIVAFKRRVSVCVCFNTHHAHCVISTNSIHKSFAFRFSSLRFRAIH